MAERLECELVSSETVYELAYSLAERIRASGFRPDLVVAISRGGFTPARIICDWLGIFNLTSIRIVHYTRAATKMREASVRYPLCTPIDGLQLLVVDDVNDSGDTLRVARTHLESLGAAELRTAVLHEKTCSPVRTDYPADTIEEWRWLIYPWAVAEDLGGFIREMVPPPLDVADAGQRLRDAFGISVSPTLLERLLRLVATQDEV